MIYTSTIPLVSGIIATAQQHKERTAGEKIVRTPLSGGKISPKLTEEENLVE